MGRMWVGLGLASLLALPSAAQKKEQERVENAMQNHRTMKPDRNVHGLFPNALSLKHHQSRNEDCYNYKDKEVNHSDSHATVNGIDHHINGSDYACFGNS